MLEDDEITYHKQCIDVLQLLEAGEWKLKCNGVGKHAGETVRS
jgi:hypothetical protein